MFVLEVFSLHRQTFEFKDFYAPRWAPVTIGSVRA